MEGKRAARTAHDNALALTDNVKQPYNITQSDFHYVLNSALAMCQK